MMETSAPRAIDKIQLIETNFPDELKNLPQWAVWKYFDNNGKISKPSYDPRTGRLASPTDPTTWSTYAEACLFLLANPEYNGLTFALTSVLGLVFIDLDHCIIKAIDEPKRRVHDQARYIAKLANSYTEESPSRTGLHILLKGEIPGARRKSQLAEMYSNARFMTVTGRRAGKAEAIRHDQNALDEIYNIAFPPENKPEPQNQLSYNYLSAPDEEVRKKAETARNGAKFAQLWRGDISAYKKDLSGEPDKSRADLALCSMLAYWSNSDFLQIDRLFRNSGLYLNYPETIQKWHKPHNSEGETYGQMTIKRAIAELRKF